MLQRRGDHRRLARATHVKEALDLCLACKGCKGDCPVNVDMATYKAEFLSHYYEGRLRPRAAYAMGLIHWWARLAVARCRGWRTSSTQHAGRWSPLLKWLGGIAAAAADAGVRRARRSSDWFAQRAAPQRQAAAR